MFVATCADTDRCHRPWIPFDGGCNPKRPDSVLLGRFFEHNCLKL